jgi:hypothetical protein
MIGVGAGPLLRLRGRLAMKKKPKKDEKKGPKKGK